jgi:hypothetical protein
MAAINPLIATDIFIYATLIAFLFAIYSIKNNKFQEFSTYAPTLLRLL